jgi:hypothetical protein
MRDSNPSTLHAAIALLSQLTAQTIHASDSSDLRELLQLCASWEMRIGDELIRRHLPPRR